ncbi:hypothetical protein JTB14_023442 [Gonioctena quinquepunctata]|nr:hypothetical protein JTB14_023442 [Gonioctena quinquepunctata]
MSIYDISRIVASAMPLALTPSNIQAGFRKTGIYPYNRHLFIEIDFAPSFVTNRSNPENTTEVTDRPNHDYTTESAVVSTLNAIPSEDETPPLSPSLSTEELQTETTVQQQAINNEVPTKEQENVDERQETLSTLQQHYQSGNITETVY